MKKRNRILAGLLCAAMALTAGCGKTETTGEETKEGEEAEVKEEDQYLSWIQEAFKKYNEEKVRGTITETTDTLEDGSTGVSKTIITIDTEKQQVMIKNEYSNPEWENSVDYYTKEGDKEYNYTNGYTWDENGNSSSIPLKVLLTEDDPIYGYSFYAKEENPYESNKEIEISDLKASKEGEEELDGIAALKFKVEYKQQPKEETTWESVLKDYELTEDDVAMLEGFSDQVDAYVEQLKRKQNAENVDIVYITSDEHKLLCIEHSKVDFSEEENTVTSQFFDGANKLSYAKERMAEGISQDEAIRMANEAFMGSVDTDSMQRTVSYVSVENFVTGGQCEAIGELPADGKEITCEQFYKGEY